MCVALSEVLYKRFSVCDVKYCFTHINLINMIVEMKVTSLKVLEQE